MGLLPGTTPTIGSVNPKTPPRLRQVPNVAGEEKVFHQMAPELSRDTMIAPAAFAPIEATAPVANWPPAETHPLHACVLNKNVFTHMAWELSTSATSVSPAGSCAAPGSPGNAPPALTSD